MSLKSKLDLVIYPKSGNIEIGTSVVVFDLRSYYHTVQQVEAGLFGRASKYSYYLKGFIRPWQQFELSGKAFEEDKREVVFPIFRKIEGERYLFCPNLARLALLKATGTSKENTLGLSLPIWNDGVAVKRHQRFVKLDTWLIPDLAPKDSENSLDYDLRLYTIWQEMARTCFPKLSPCLP